MRGNETGVMNNIVYFAGSAASATAGAPRFRRSPSTIADWVEELQKIRHDLQVKPYLRRQASERVHLLHTEASCKMQQQRRHETTFPEHWTNGRVAERVHRPPWSTLCPLPLSLLRSPHNPKRVKKTRHFSPRHDDRFACVLTPMQGSKSKACSLG